MATEGDGWVSLEREFECHDWKGPLPNYHLPNTWSKVLDDCCSCWIGSLGSRWFFRYAGPKPWWTPAPWILSGNRLGVPLVSLGLESGPLPGEGAPGSHFGLPWFHGFQFFPHHMPKQFLKGLCNLCPPKLHVVPRWPLSLVLSWLMLTPFGPLAPCLFSPLRCFCCCCSYLC